MKVSKNMSQNRNKKKSQKNSRNKLQQNVFTSGNGTQPINKQQLWENANLLKNQQDNSENNDKKQQMYIAQGNPAQICRALRNQMEQEKNKIVLKRPKSSATKVIIQTQLSKVTNNKQIQQNEQIQKQSTDQTLQQSGQISQGVQEMCVIGITSQRVDNEQIQNVQQNITNSFFDKRYQKKIFNANNVQKYNSNININVQQKINHNFVKQESISSQNNFNVSTPMDKKHSISEQMSLAKQTTSFQINHEKQNNTNFYSGRSTNSYHNESNSDTSNCQLPIPKQNIQQKNKNNKLKHNIQQYELNNKKQLNIIQMLPSTNKNFKSTKRELFT